MMEDFDRELKDFFQKREIQPSTDAWQRMENMLSEEKVVVEKKKRLFYLVPIAASIALFVGVWAFFKPQKSDVMKMQPVEKYVKLQEDDDSVKHSIPENKANVVPKREKQEKIADRKNVNQTNNKDFIENIVDEDEIGEFAFEQHIVQKSDKEIAAKTMVSQSKTEIYVNPSKLLRVAEMERQVDNASTGGQNFWRKVKEVNTVVENINK